MTQGATAPKKETAVAPRDTTLATAEKPAASTRHLLESAREQLEKALPGKVDVERFIRIAVTAVLRTPLLLQCDRVSILGACIEAAQLGLELDGILGQAYLVPFRNHGKLQAQMIPGYRGYITLAHRSGRVSYINAHVVHEQDRFRYQFGTASLLDHVPSDLAGPARGRVTHAYCIVRYLDGAVDFDVMSTDEIEAVRAISKAADKGPWVDHWDEMAKKTVIRRKAKTVPLSAEWQRAAILDEYADAGIVRSVGDGADKSLVKLATETRRDELRDKYLGEGEDPPPLTDEERAALDAKDAKSEREPGTDDA